MNAHQVLERLDAARAAATDPLNRRMLAEAAMDIRARLSLMVHARIDANAGARRALFGAEVRRPMSRLLSDARYVLTEYA